MPIQLVLVAVGLALLCAGVRIVPMDARMVVVRFGQPMAVVGPGIRWVLPGIDRVHRVPLDRWLPDWRQLPERDISQRLLHLAGEAAGSNLAKPHPIEFFLYFPSEPVARRAADTIRSAGFEVSVDRGADGTSWLCLAVKWMTPAHGELVRIRARFEELTSPLGGEYDGWGTPVVP